MRVIINGFEYGLDVFVLNRRPVYRNIKYYARRQQCKCSILTGREPLMIIFQKLFQSSSARGPRLRARPNARESHAKMYTDGGGLIDRVFRNSIAEKKIRRAPTFRFSRILCARKLRDSFRRYNIFINVIVIIVRRITIIIAATRSLFTAVLFTHHAPVAIRRTTDDDAEYNIVFNLYDIIIIYYIST